MQQPTFNSQSLLMMGAAIFVSVTAAVIVSTLVIMSLMRGEIASALTSQVHNEAPVTAQTTSAGCSVPASEVSQSGEASASDATGDYAAPLTGSVHFAKYVPVATSHSFNNTTNNTVTNNVSNTEFNSKTIVKDSYNDNSNTVVVKDNTVNVNSNNNNSTNSGNTTNNTQNNIQTTNNVTTTSTTNNTVTANNTTNLNSNNTTNVNSNNTLENHVLSDNVVVVLPTV